YRTLGDANITIPGISHPSPIAEILRPLDRPTPPDRPGRTLAHEPEDAFERPPAACYPSSMTRAECVAMTIIAQTPAAATRTGTARPQVRIVIVGHVDHGKSTLVGRLLHETGSLPEGKLDMLKAVSARRGMPFEWSFLLDALQTERDQGITIDTTQIRFRTG